MTFSEALNEYIDELGINSMELSEASGISQSSISRYRNGDREPSFDSKYMDNLIDGLFKLSVSKGIDTTKDTIKTRLTRNLNSITEISYDQYLDNLNYILKAFDIKGNNLAKQLAYDPSHISKILSGQRRPGNINKFTYEFSTYIISHISTIEDEEHLLRILDATQSSEPGAPQLVDKLVIYLKTHKDGDTDSKMEPNDPTSFLMNLEKFDLNEYIKAIHFDELKVPTIPVAIRQSKSYYGVAEFKKAEIAFLKTTALSKQRGDVFLYSDMPMTEMGRDTDFAKNGCLEWPLCLRRV